MNKKNLKEIMSEVKDGEALIDQMAYIFGDGTEIGDKIVGTNGTINIFNNVNYISQCLHELVKEMSTLRGCRTQREFTTRLLKIYGISRDLVQELATEEHIGHSWVDMPFCYVNDEGDVRMEERPRMDMTEIRDLCVEDRRLEQPEKN